MGYEGIDKDGDGVSMKMEQVTMILIVTGHGSGSQTIFRTEHLSIHSQYQKTETCVILSSLIPTLQEHKAFIIQAE